MKFKNVNAKDHLTHNLNVQLILMQVQVHITKSKSSVYNVQQS